MVLIKVRDKEYLVEFRHATKHSGAVGSKINATAVTTCVVIAVPSRRENAFNKTPDFIAIESVICSPEDQFSRHEGRLRSLVKCLTHFRQLREIDLQFAAAYCAVTQDDLAALIDFIPGLTGSGEQIQRIALAGRLPA